METAKGRRPTEPRLWPASAANQDLGFSHHLHEQQQRIGSFRSCTESEEEKERDDPPLVNSLCGGASGPEPFSEGRPVKSILPHIVKGQHRGTRL